MAAPPQTVLRGRQTFPTRRSSLTCRLRRHGPHSSAVSTAYLARAWPRHNLSSSTRCCASTAPQGGGSGEPAASGGGYGVGCGGPRRCLPLDFDPKFVEH